MKDATLIYPHQLFVEHPALKPGRPVYLVEEPLFLTEFPIHKQKLLLHRLSMQHYKKQLELAGYKVSYLNIQSLANTAQAFQIINTDNVTELHIVDTTDSWLEKRISEAVLAHEFKVVRYESPLFILPKAEAILRYQNSNKFMSRFYKQLRIDKKILIVAGDKPLGDQWSFDADNRKKLPKDIKLPAEISIYQNNTEIENALFWLKSVPAESYGESKVWIPWTREDAKLYLQEFLTDRLSQFGQYEDAIAKSHTRLFHSTLSPLINIGLLTPQEIITAVIKYGEENKIALNSVEGFVRQVIGWREFIRASYESDGGLLRTKNFWRHKKALPKSFWDASTGVLPLDIVIRRTLDYGYTHHIERLMVLGNFMLLTKTDPDQVYRWFMAMYVDAYDWVMVPNIYGMSQFADGGMFATKPYISGSSYLKKMSDYPKGEWEELWTGLYWNFIEEHKDFFLKNHRLSMMPRLLEKMDPAKRKSLQSIAKKYLGS